MPPANRGHRGGHPRCRSCAAGDGGHRHRVPRGGDSHHALRREPRLAHDVLATGTFNILEAAVAANVKRVVSASSASIYGQAEEFPTNEKHHGYGNRTIYGATKSYSEGLLRSFYEMYGLNYVALRYFNVYGPRMDAFGVYTEVMIRWMERLAKGQPCLILGDGAQTMDFVFVTDIARANLRAAIDLGYF